MQCFHFSTIFCFLFRFPCLQIYSNMADTDSVFEFLHMQIVEYIHEVHGKEGEVQKNSYTLLLE